MITTPEQFNRYSIATFDWDKCLSFAKEASNFQENSTVYEALIFAAIICYYRPFSPNEKDRSSPAISQLCIEDFCPLSEEEIKLHKMCKELRNKALAHSEYAFNPTRLNEITGLIWSKPFSLLSQPFDLGAFIQLVSKLQCTCHHKRADHVSKRQP